MVVSSLELGLKCVNIPLTGQIIRAARLVGKSFGVIVDSLTFGVCGWLVSVGQPWRAAECSGRLAHLTMSAGALAFTWQARRLRSQALPGLD